MGVDHGEFYDGVDGGFHAEVYVARIAMGRKRQKNYAISDLMAGGPSRPYTADELRTMAGGLQDLRFLDPETARIQALDILTAAFHQGIDAGVDCYFKALLSLAAVYRARGSYGTAAAYLLKALHVDGRHGRERAVVLRALISLSIDQGDAEPSLQAADLALSEFARLGDIQSQGRVLVSKGAVLGQIDRLAEASELYRKSLPLIADAQWYERFGALHGLGLCLALLDEPTEALHYAEEAVVALKAHDAPLLRRADALWLRAEIRLQKGLNDQGLRDLATVLEIYLDQSSSPIDLAAVTLRLCHLYKASGKDIEMQAVTNRAIPRLRKAAHQSKLLLTVLTDFFLQHRRGELALDVMRHTFSEVLKLSRTLPAAARLVEL